MSLRVKELFGRNPGRPSRQDLARMVALVIRQYELWYEPETFGVEVAKALKKMGEKE